MCVGVGWHECCAIVSSTSTFAARRTDNSACRAYASYMAMLAIHRAAHTETGYIIHIDNKAVYGQWMKWPTAK